MSSHHYRQILKTSTITGISRAISVVAGFARTKIVSVYIGPAGMGMLTAYSSMIALIGTVTSLGLGSSAIRTIAASAANSDTSKIAEAILALRRLCWLTGLVGTVFCAAFSPWISLWTFGSTDNAWPVALLSVTILLGQLSTGQTALLRGLRQVRQLANGTIYSSVASISLAAAWIIPLGARGIVPFVISLAVVNLIGTWWFARTVRLQKLEVTWKQSLGHSREMLSMGLAFLATNWMTVGATYLISVMLIRADDANLNGLYQAAWSCSGALVGFVLTAMAQDFYPRLAAAIHEPDEVRVIINSQVEVGVLLSLPCLVAMSGLAFCIFPILFSKDFQAASQAFPWFVMGSFGRVVSWPMGYYLVAAGENRWFLVSEFLANALHVAAVYWLAKMLGVLGGGIAFCGLYVAYTIVMLVLLRRLAGFTPTSEAVRYCLAGYFAIALAACAGPVAAAAITAVTTVVCLRALVRKIGTEAPLIRRLVNLPVLGRIIS